MTISIAVATIISGCTKYENQNKYFSNKDQAAIAFFIENKSKIESLSSQQEMLGWVLHCNDKGYAYTNYVIGDLSNTVRPHEVDKGDCEVGEFLHSHPITNRITDYFSKADIQIAKWRGIYLFSTEGYYVRVHNGKKDRYGTIIANIRYK